jgi:hypothetical protein
VDPRASITTGIATTAASVLCLIVGLLIAASVAAPPVAGQEGDSSTITHDGEELVLESALNQTVTGTSELPPGTEIAVRLRSTDGVHPFLKSRGVTVAPDGTFEARFDLSDIEAGTEFTAVVLKDHEQISEPVSGRVVDPGTPVRPSSVAMQSVTTVAHGDTARLNVSMPTEGRAILTIGNESAVRYSITVQLTDRTGDGMVVLHFDTAAAGTATPTVFVTGNDGYEVLRAETHLDSVISPGEYPLVLYEDQRDDPVALGQLIIHEENATDKTPGNETPTQTTTADDPRAGWADSVLGIAGAIAIVSGLAALRLYGR